MPPAAPTARPAETAASDLDVNQTVRFVLRRVMPKVAVNDVDSKAM